MATDPNNIFLSQEDKHLLAKLVDESGKALSDALREAVTIYLSERSTATQPNGTQDARGEREQAFLHAAGTWADVDTDALLEEIYSQRLHATRPKPQL